MGNRERLAGLAMVLALVVLAKLGHQTYQWYAHEDERVRIHELTGELRGSGMEVVTTQLEADSLRALIDGMDEGLDVTRRRVESYGRGAVGGTLPGAVYDAYRGELSEYNRLVVSRNARYERWREVISRNHAAVDRFNRLADSIRALAAAMGEPYFSIPTPAEIAVDAGIAAPAPR